MSVTARNHYCNLAIRVASSADKDLIFKWRNSRFLVSLGSSQKKVSKKEHSAWFDKIITRNDTHILILLKNNEPIGQLRFDGASSSKYIVTIYLVESCVGKGYGSWFLKEGLELVTSLDGEAQFEAIVNETNVISLKLFKKLGFIPSELKHFQTINGINSIRLVRYGDNSQYFEFNELIKFYKNNVRNYASDVGSLGWGSEASQTKRFEILSKIGNIQGSKILDVGCGLGDFGHWLNEQGYECAYEGVDISEEMIRQARLKYPSFRLEVRDILSLKNVNSQYSYVFASGIFNRKINNHEKFIYCMIRKMYQMARIGVAFNVLSLRADFKNRDEYYADPDRLISLCETISNRVVLNHDYMNHDFTIYLYR